MNFGTLKTPIRFYIRLLLIVCWVLLWIPIIYPSYRLQWNIHPFLIRMFSKGMNILLGVKVKITGEFEKKRPTLFVSNHCSYLDIYALASFLPAVFLAKDEIADWPVVGWLSSLSGVVFISRNPQKTLKNIQKVQKSISNSFILFPEGTTSDGNRVKRFNSSFFSLVHQLGNEKGMVVQPISIAYTRLAGIPMGNYYRPYFSWFGAMDLAPHAKECLSFSSITVEVTVHPAIEGESLKDRKKLALICEKMISASMTESLTRLKPKKNKSRETVSLAA